MNIDSVLSALSESGNLRTLPSDLGDGITDFTSNDYLGLGADISLREAFFESHPASRYSMTSAASRLLAGSQSPYSSLERIIEDSYQSIGRNNACRKNHPPKALLFNSGYHANTGIIPAVSGKTDIILADRLVHASIIDGIRLSGARFTRFPHNDFDRLEKLIEKHSADSDAQSSVIVIVESVYSMDGDRADLRRLVDLKRRYPRVILYVDEAHAIGVCGQAGLGEAVAQGVHDEIDILVGTFGKALASAGAFALVSDKLRSFLVNKARSLIFSTALPPMQVAWTEFVWRHALGVDSARESLRANSMALARIIPGGEPSHIRPLIVGDAARAVALSTALRNDGFNVLPIRTPTVPPGTERLRFSLSAQISPGEIARLADSLSRNKVTA